MAAHVEDAPEIINLKVLGPDTIVVQFKIKKYTVLTKLLNAYCERTGIPRPFLRFSYNGQDISEDDTASSLEMKDGDAINTYLKQLADVPENINLRVLGRNNAVVQFKVNKRTPLKNLMISSCEKLGLSMASVKFTFNRQLINEADTPYLLNMKEGDAIKVYQRDVCIHKFMF